MKPKLIAFIATSLLVISSSTFAAANFPATRYPFQPSLLVNNNPVLCKTILQKARQKFFSEEAEGVALSQYSDGFEWVEWERPVELQIENANIDRLDLDLDGSGKKQVVLMHSFTHSWRGDNFNAFVFKNYADFSKSFTTPDNLISKLTDIESSLPDKAPHDAPIRYYPDALAVNSGSATNLVNTGSDWQGNNLFHWNKRYYFFDEKNPFIQLTQAQQTVYRLRADGKVELQCRIQTIPENEHVADLFLLSGFSSLHKTISTIGEGGNDGGSLQAGYRHNNEALAASTRIAYRPWAVSRARDGGGISGRNYYQYDSRLMTFIEDWSFGDIWSRREYQTFLQHILPAEESMAEYLKNKFGLSPHQATQKAKEIIESVIGNWIQVPNYYDHDSDLYTVEYHPLNKALFEHDYITAKTLIENFAPREHNYDDAIDIFLIEAVEWPAGIELLLKAKADVNKKNEFGKTPLMMAAHMNRPDTVKLLLNHGANPNLTTDTVGKYSISMERGQRTALMYAAENASPQVITLLLDAGADMAAVDSENNGISFYLNKNPRLTEVEKKMDIRTLTLVSQR